MQAEDLKRRIAKERDGRVYPADLRLAIVEYGSAKNASGVLWRDIAGELGVHEQTIRYWKKMERKLAGRGGTVARVEIVADESVPSGELVVEYGAFRVRGLDVAGVAELLRRLA